MTTLTSQHVYNLDQFEGPLDFLLYLVQKHEVEITDIPIQRVTEQYLEALDQSDVKDVDEGAEFLALAAQLLLIKSRMLLPKHEQEGDDDAEPDPRFQVIEQLMEYCRFKELAKDFSSWEERLAGSHYRGISDEFKRQRIPSGVEHLSLEDLAVVFRESMVKAASRVGGTIAEEEWRVIDKIRALRKQIKEERCVTAVQLFASDKSKLELIVIFLAILELMKLGEIAIVREAASGSIAIAAHNRNEEDVDGAGD